MVPTATCATRDLLPQAQNNDLNQDAGETEHSLWVDNRAYYTTQSSLPEFWLGRIRIINELNDGIEDSESFSWASIVEM